MTDQIPHSLRHDVIAYMLRTSPKLKAIESNSAPGWPEQGLSSTRERRRSW